MTISIDDAVIKFREYVEIVEGLESKLQSQGFKIEKTDSFELGADWLVLLDKERVALLSWNIPHYIAFEPYIAQREAPFALDNVKDVSDWRKFLYDVEASIIGTKNKGERSGPEK